jgi:membrane associated rhomboid family serine protease
MGFADRPYYGQQETRGFGSRLGSHSVVTWLLAINGIVFVLDMIFTHSARASWLSLTRWGNFNIEQAVYGLQLWRWITYQFLHVGLLHIFFNLLVLYFFGPLMESWWGPRRFLAFYLLCGSTGALVFTGLRFIPGLLEISDYTMLMGASGSIYGILIGAAVLYPHHQVMLLIPPIPLKLRTLAIAVLVLSLLGLLAGSQNAAGDAAHLGGALMGFLLVRWPGVLNWSGAGQRLQRLSPTRLRHKARKGAIERQVKREQDFEREVDRILAKVAHHGLHSLTWKEKRTLQKATEKQRQ